MNLLLMTVARINFLARLYDIPLGLLQARQTPRGRGAAVPRIKEVPATAIVAWVMDIMGNA
jgi:hypothetical protein